MSVNIKRLFVGGLHLETTVSEFGRIFEKFGPIVDAYVVAPSRDGMTSVCGFLEFKNEADAALAIEEMDGAMETTHMRKLRVSIAKPKTERV